MSGKNPIKRRHRFAVPYRFNPNNLQQRVVGAVMRYVSESFTDAKDLKSLRARLKKFTADDTFWRSLETLVKVGTDINKTLKGMFVSVD